MNCNASLNVQIELEKFHEIFQKTTNNLLDLKMI